MVEEVEKLSLELEICPFAQMKLPPYSEIQLIDRESAQGVTSERALSRWNWTKERSQLRIWIAGYRDPSVVQSPSTRRGRIVQVQGNAFHEIRAHCGNHAETGNNHA